MKNCTETRLKGIAAIIAVPVGDLSLTSSAKVSPIVKTGDDTQFTFHKGNAIGIGRGSAISTLIRKLPSTDYSNAKDRESDNVAGRAHTVTVQSEINDDNPNTLEYLLILERMAHSLILFLTNGRCYIVTATEDSYQCTVNKDTKSTSVEFHIHNLMGCQRCTEVPVLV